MNILQISAPKSGSYWLHTILSQILLKKGTSRKFFLKNQPVYHDIKHLSLSFNGQVEVDMVDIEEEGCFYRVSSLFKAPITDMENYARSSNLTWTHSALCNNSFRFFQLYDKKIIIVRDPRDRALSSAKFAFTPYMKKYYPSPYFSSEEYFEKEYENLLEQWVWFTGNYIYKKDDLGLHFVFYERLLHDFENEFRALLRYLDVDLSLKDQEEIKNTVSFMSMKSKSPRHLNKGKYGKWVEKLNETQKSIAVDKAGYLLDLLNYPLGTFPKDKKQPKLPVEINIKELQNKLEQIHWYPIFQ